jgi:hypothetical protein
MAKLTHRIELTIDDRDLILQYGYASCRLEASLRRWPKARCFAVWAWIGWSFVG